MARSLCRTRMVSILNTDAAGKPLRVRPTVNATWEHVGVYYDEHEAVALGVDGLLKSIDVYARNASYTYRVAELANQLFIYRIAA